MTNSGATVVHRGAEAKKVIQEVGHERILDSRYVYTSDDGTANGKLKARWCIRGYLDPDVLDLNTSSPTLSSECFAIALQVLASFKWQMCLADIEAAFLRGDGIERPKGRVLVRIPKDGIPGLEHEDVIQLRKPVYGLVDAPELWWDSLTKTLRDLNMKQSELVKCMFYYRDEHGVLQGVAAFHVDDLIFGGYGKFMTEVFEPLKKKYLFKHVTVGNGEFLGKKLVQNHDFGVTIHQREHARDLECIHVSKERRKQRQDQTTDEEKSQMRGVLGELNWLVTGSRPDLAAGCSLLQQRVTKSTVEDMIEVNRLVACAQDFCGLELKVKTIAPQDLEICAWSDASFANAESWESQGGYMVCGTDRNLRDGKWADLSPWRWRSYKQDRQVASTLGAELMTLSRTIAMFEIYVDRGSATKVPASRRSDIDQ